MLNSAVADENRLASARRHVRKRHELAAKAPTRDLLPRFERAEAHFVHEALGIGRIPKEPACFDELHDAFHRETLLQKGDDGVVLRIHRAAILVENGHRHHGCVAGTEKKPEELGVDDFGLPRRVADEALTAVLDDPDSAIAPAAHERAVDPAQTDRVHTVLLAKAHETFVDEPGIGHRQDVERGIVGHNTLDSRDGGDGARRASESRC